MSDKITASEDTHTLAYYNIHAEEFYQSTLNIEFSAMQNSFLSKLKTGAYILDFGCGSGRDTKYFLEQGFHVDAVDGSSEIKFYDSGTNWKDFAADITYTDYKAMTDRQHLSRAKSMPIR